MMQSQKASGQIAQAAASPAHSPLSAYTEQVVQFGPERGLVGILTKPAGDSTTSLPAVLLLNAGLLHRVGPNRIYVLIARALAANGFTVMRFDFSGLGDSQPRADHMPYAQSAPSEAQGAMDWLTATQGAERFLLMGHCAGAGFSLLLASTDARVAGAVLINMEGGDEQWTEYDRMKKVSTQYARYYGRTALFDRERWAKLVSGRADYRSIARNVFKDTLWYRIKSYAFQAEQALRSRKQEGHAEQESKAQLYLAPVAARGAQLLIVHSEGSTGLARIRAIFGDTLTQLQAQKIIELVIIPECDHLFTLLDRREGLLPLLQTLHSFGMLQFAPVPITPPGPGPMPLRTLFNAARSKEEESAPPEEERLESFADVVEAEQSAELPIQAQAPPDDERYEFALAKKVRQMASELQGKNYYEIFNLTPARFSFDKVKERYFAITREFGPDALMRLVGEEASMVQDILATVANAYDTLSDVVKKERYDELLGSERVGLGQKGDDRFQAQVQSQSGKVFIEMEEWDNAEKALQDACNIEPQNGDYLAHLGWAIYRNPKNGSSRAMLEKAKQLVNRALTLERTPDGYAFKGWMLLEAGQESLAEGDFNKALKLDARHGLARRGLRTLIDHREQEKKGLFRRMFS